MKGVRACFNDDGVVTGHYVATLCIKSCRVNSYAEPQFFPLEKTHLFLYERVALLRDPSSGNCIMLLKHTPPWDLLSYAWVGDAK
jgi:hypothetical protein